MAKVIDFAARRTAKKRTDEEARMAAVAAQHWTGSKYERDRNVADIAKDIRKDIAAAIKRKQIPPIKASVTIKRFSGGQSISITVDAVPKGFVIPNLKRIRQDVGVAPREPIASLLSPQASALLKVLEKIGNSYNFDKSDSMTDYYHVAFYLHVDFGAVERRQREEIGATIARAYGMRTR